MDEMRELNIKLITIEKKNQTKDHLIDKIES